MNGRAFLLAAAAGLAACGGTARYTLEAPRRSVVVVANNNWATARIYLISPLGLRTRLATVETSTEERVQLPRAVDQWGTSVGFEVELIGGGGSVAIDPVMFGPGDVIRVTIQNHLALTSVMVGAR